MGQLAIGVGAAALGGVTGGLVPGVGVLLGAQIGFLGGSILANILFPTEVDAGGPSRDDIRLSSAATGRFVPIPYGTVRVGGQYIWVDEPLFKTKTEDAKGGPEIKTREVFLTWATGICEGPVAAVTRIWLDDELIFDISDGNSEGVAISPEVLQGISTGQFTVSESLSFDGGVQSITAEQYGPIRIYLGNDGQPAEPLMQVDERITEAMGSDAADWAPPMNGLCYAVFELVPGKAINNHFPQCEFEVMTAAGVGGSFLSWTGVASAVKNRVALLGDLTTYLGITQSSIYRWNTLSKNVLNPTIVPFASTPGDALAPVNVGPYLAAEPYVFRVENVAVPGSASDWHTYSAITGQKVGGEQRANMAGPQFHDIYLWPDTEFPTKAFILGGTTGEIEIISIPTVGTNFPIGAYVGDPRPGSITNTTYRPFGFVGPDECFYVLAAQWPLDTDTHVVKFDPHTLAVLEAVSVQRSEVYPVKTDDPFDDGSRTLMTYDRQHDKIVLLHQNGWLRKFDRPTLAIDPEDDLKLPAGAQIGDQELTMHNGPIGGKIWLQQGGANSYIEVDLVSMTTTGNRISDARTQYPGLSLFNEQPSYDPVNHGLWVEDNSTANMWFLPLNRRSPGTVTAASIAEDVSDRVDLPATLRDTTLWASDDIAGFLIGRRITGRKVLETLAGAINGDYRTQDGKVQFIKLDSGSVKTVFEDDLGAGDSIDAQVPRRDLAWPYERELPQRIDLQYIDRGMDYASNTVSYDRPLEGFKGRSKRNVQMPLVFDENSSPQPIEIAERLLYSFDAQKENHQIALPWTHLDLNVGDAFDYQANGFTHRVRAEKWSLAENNRILIEARSEESAIFTPSGGAANSGSLIFQSPVLGGTAGVEAQFLLEPNLLRDIDDSRPPGTMPFLVAAYPQSPESWRGGQLLQSLDGGQAFTKVLATLGADQVVQWGLVTSVLADGATTIADRANSVTVNMRHGILGGVARADLLEDPTLNNLAIGRDGRWEIVRYETAANLSGSPDDSGDSYTLSNLHRGMRGTEHNTANHQAGDLVIKLDAANFRKVEVDTSEIGVTRYYKLVPFGADETLIPAVALTLNGEALKPYAPVHVRGSRAASGTWTVTWVRRTRIGGEWSDNADVPLGEDSEVYEVDVLEAPGGSVVTGKTGLTSESVSFTEAELGSLGSPDSTRSLTVKIYQISATVGRGHPAEATLQG